MTDENQPNESTEPEAPPAVLFVGRLLVVIVAMAAIAFGLWAVYNVLPEVL